MINSSKIFTFNGIRSDDASFPKIQNVTLNNDFYQVQLLGARTIVEDKIQGRDNPYLYDVDSSPLQFSITIAFEDYIEVSEINKVVHWLYTPRTYKQLVFEDNPEVEYFGIFIGEPTLHYVGRNNTGYKYIGYITADFRLNAPYGYTPVISGSGINSSFSTINTGNLTTYPSFDIINTGGVNNSITLTNTKPSDSNILIQLNPGEKIVPYNNVYDTTVVTDANRLLQYDGVEFVDITSYLNLGSNETIKDLKSSGTGVIILTSGGRLFMWGARAVSGWLVAERSNTGSNYATDKPEEAPSTVYSLIGADTIHKIWTASNQGGVYISTLGGKLITWGYNYYGQMMLPTTSTISYATPADRAAQLNLNTGEYVDSLFNFGGYRIGIITNEPRYFKSTWVTNKYEVELTTTTPQSILNSGETFISSTSSQSNDQMHLTSEGRIIRTNSTLNPTDYTSYYGPLLNSGETFISIHSPSRLEFWNGGTSYVPFYLVTSDNRLIAAGPIPGTTIETFIHQPQVVDLSSVLNNELIEDTTFNVNIFNGEEKYLVFIYTNTGRVIMFNTKDDIAEPEDLSEYPDIISSFSYIFASDDVLSFNGYTKSLSLESGSNPYIGWDKKYLTLEPGSNQISLSGSGFEISYAYRAPKYI